LWNLVTALAHTVNAVDPLAIGPEAMEYAGGRLIVAQDGPIGWITFNQPERLNAVRRDMWDDLPAAVADLTSRSGVRAIVVKGAGDKAFISGADIAEFDIQRNNAVTNRNFTVAVSAATASDRGACARDAMINGFCIGGACIASACDIRICSEASRFGVPAGKLGLGYELDNFARLQSIVGRGVAMEMVATARQYSSQEALAAGFVNRVAPVTDLENTVRDIVAMIVTNAPLRIVAAKLSSRAAAIDPLMEVEAQQAIDICFDSEDFREGRTAFRERRLPAFKGR
jgi:enoyl-CoA hydratase/carnithine racemase